MKGQGNMDSRVLGGSEVSWKNRFVFLHGRIL